jgi:hypothetical protein
VSLKVPDTLYRALPVERRMQYGGNLLGYLRCTFFSAPCELLRASGRFDRLHDESAHLFRLTDQAKTHINPLFLDGVSLQSPLPLPLRGRFIPVAADGGDGNAAARAATSACHQASANPVHCI